MLVSAVSVFEAFSILTSDNPEKTTGYLFMGVALFALTRYFMLRRKQYNQDKKDGKFK
jgi:preprotein translocase subunit YajC